MVLWELADSLLLPCVSSLEEGTASFIYSLFRIHNRIQMEILVDLMKAVIVVSSSQNVANPYKVP